MILKNYNSYMFIFDMKNNPNIKVYEKYYCRMFLNKETHEIS